MGLAERTLSTGPVSPLEKYTHTVYIFQESAGPKHEHSRTVKNYVHISSNKLYTQHPYFDIIYRAIKLVETPQPVFINSFQDRSTGTVKEIALHISIPDDRGRLTSHVYRYMYE